jgi:homoserine O-acetyltransferase
MMIESIVSDPSYAGGDYKEEPGAMRIANVFYGIASNGGTLAYQKLAPTSEAADKFVEARLAAPAPPDANDFVWQWSSSHDYDPAPGLERIEAKLLAINSADDERNPPETGVMEDGLKRLKDGGLYLIPASADTRGHGTTAMARFYAEPLREFLGKAPHRGM